MSNMSYCRFINTRDDVADCLEALRCEECLSGAEAHAGKAMFKDFLDFCDAQGIIPDYDEDEVDRLFRDLEKREEEDGD